MTDRDRAYILCMPYEEAGSVGQAIFAGASVPCAGGCGEILFMTADIVARVTAADMDPYPLCMACLIDAGDDIDLDDESGTLPGQVEHASERTGIDAEQIAAARDALMASIRDLRSRQS